LNFYTPPAFKDDGDPRLRGRPRGELLEKVRQGAARLGRKIKKMV
jgi:hypothetical protein